MKPHDRFRRRKERNSIAQLSLISLMDIFTILLLFLLVHLSGEEIVLPSSEALQLPASTAQKLPRPNLTVMVTDKDILVEGKSVMKVSEALRQESATLPPVKQELIRLAERTKQIAKQNPSVTFTGHITVMGDRKIPFQLLRKIMTTCAQAEFPHIALAVIQKDKVG
jgi:biopolymer transport protein ExbD